jgi:hypothetical protein
MQTETLKENIQTPTAKTPFVTRPSWSVKNSNNTPFTMKTPLKDTIQKKYTSFLGEKTNVDTPRGKTPLLKSVLKRTVKKDSKLKSEKSTRSKLTVYKDNDVQVEYCPPPVPEIRNNYHNNSVRTRR